MISVLLKHPTHTHARAHTHTYTHTYIYIYIYNVTMTNFSNVLGKYLTENLGNTNSVLHR